MSTQARRGGFGRRVRRRAVTVAMVTAGVWAWAACGGGQDSGTPARGGAVTPTEAHRMAVEQIEGDPAVTELSRDAFETMARLVCESLDEGGSTQRWVDDISRQPTSTGKPMRRESARAIVTAGVRGHCPRHASQLR
ncbi:MAG TPA: hypothetical protein VHE80_00115 [Acidimicrobiales bacterium]|nr:hypothetical protein [Acidimicrobiales bacterium]